MLESNIQDPTITFSQPGLDIVGMAEFIFGVFTNDSPNSLFGVLEKIWNIYSVIAILFSLLFFIGFIYAKIRYSQLAAIEQAQLREAEAKWAARYERPSTKNARWESIERRVLETNPESWRIAIIEADIMLEETLTQAGYVGQSIGEKLKSANPQSFTTLQDAWEAHKVRNAIAHVGSDFVLTQRVAQQTITQFERVFKEFGVI